MRKLALLAVVTAVLAAPAYAHKLTLFAAQEGAVIAGRARYIPGGGAEGLTVEVRNANGEAIGEVTTDSDGRFTYAPQSEGEHVFVIITKDGHTAQSRVTPGAQADDSPDDETSETALDEEAIAAAVARQLAPFEADLAAWRAEERRRDWTAAGGMAAGLIGVVLFAAARRRQRP